MVLLASNLPFKITTAATQKDASTSPSNKEPASVAHDNDSSSDDDGSEEEYFTDEPIEPPKNLPEKPKRKRRTKRIIAEENETVVPSKYFLYARCIHLLLLTRC